MIRFLLAILAVIAAAGLWHVQNAYSPHVAAMVILGAAWGAAIVGLVALEFMDLHKKGIADVIAEL